jgi:protein gp37
MEASWVRSIRSQCRAVKVPFFFKQWGGTRKKLAGRVLDGRTYGEFPVIETGIMPDRHARLRLVESTVGA